MRKPFNFTLTGILGLVLAIIVWKIVLPQGPTYKGKTVTEWFQDRVPFSEEMETREDIDEALRHMGTNAFPVLLKMLRKTDLPAVIKLVELARRQRIMPIRYVSASVRHSQALYAFGCLREKARPAVPALIQIYEEHISDSSQLQAVSVIADIGPAAAEALPALLKGLNSTNESVLAITIYAIGRVNSPHAARAEMVVAQLIPFLQHPALEVRVSTIMTLRVFGPAAKPAVPLLSQLLNDPEVKSDAKYALQKIDPDTAEKLGVSAEDEEPSGARSREGDPRWTPR